jgi:hypothetical protein
MLAYARKKTGFENQELEELKTCIKKVPILAQCLNTERAKVRNSRPAAASSAYALVDECSRDELHEKIKRLKENQDPPTDELFRCFSSMRNDNGRLLKLSAQIETAEKKEFYRKICSILDELNEAEKEKIKEILKINDQLSYIERIHGKYDPQTIESINNFAVMFRDKGDYKTALQMFEECHNRSRHVIGGSELTRSPYLEDIDYCKRMIKEQEEQRLGGRSKSKRNHKNKNKYFRSTRRRRYSRARGGKKIATSSSKTIKRR